MKVDSISFSLAILPLIEGSVLQPNHVKRSLGTATVSLNVPSGTPSYLGSGFIYGIPDNGNSASSQIPDHFFTDIGFNYNRAGGAQLGAPNRGWTFGEYPGRFASTLSNYRTTRKYGGRFILLVHDIWGADSTQGAGSVFPGDNGNWANYNSYLDQLISDMRANGMVDGLDIDIWNEPDISPFWPRSVDQWIQMWGIGYHRFKAAFPNALITGPSTANVVSTTASFWTTFGSFIRGNNSIPDVYTWHHLQTGQDLQTALPVYNAWLAKYGLPDRPKNINEYADPSEQNPAGAVWYISRFERANVRGLRANWASGNRLHDFMGNLLGKTNLDDRTGTGYYPCGEWWVYRYYKSAMTGQRVATTSSADNKFDVYATRSSAANTVKILASTRVNSGTYDIKVTGLSAVGKSGSVSIRTYRFDYGGLYGQVGAPVDLGVYTHAIANDEITFWVAPATAQTAYAFEFQ